MELHRLEKLVSRVQKVRFTSSLSATQRERTLSAEKYEISKIGSFTIFCFYIIKQAIRKCKNDTN